MFSFIPFSNTFLDGDGGGDSSASLSVFPSLEVTDFILKCGFDVHSRNNLQETPLHIACKTENFSSDVAVKLLEYGAHLDTPDVRDICPIGKEHALKIYDQFSLEIGDLGRVLKRQVSGFDFKKPGYLGRVFKLL